MSVNIATMGKFSQGVGSVGTTLSLPFDYTIDDTQYSIGVSINEYDITVEV